MMNSKPNIEDLLRKPMWQMTGQEYVDLHAYACACLPNMGGSAKAPLVTHLKGVHAVADYCNCSDSQVAKLLREGVLDSAIVSRIGKSIVFDGDEARRCADEYLTQQRILRRNKKNK